MSRPLRILTWHVHGGYLRALSRLPHELLLPVAPGRRAPYGGRGAGFDFPSNVTEVLVEDVSSAHLDLVLYQSRQAWECDRFEILGAEQQQLPRIYLEHDPPRSSPFGEAHPVEDRETIVVHVTPFNRRMWRNAGPTTCIEHGVVPTPDVVWTGELDRGLVVVNDLGLRGRRLGADVFEYVRRRVPLDLVGIGSTALGGLGEVPPLDLAAFAARYRFLFDPIRWTSLGLAVCEAMHVGLPVVGLATTEMATVVENGVSGWVDTDPDVLVDRMRDLLVRPDEAARLGEGAREAARRRFGIDRFVRDWDAVLRRAVGDGTATAPAPAPALALAEPT